MIRVNSESQEDEQLDEIGNRLGTRGNICQTKLDEEIAKIEKEQKVIDEDYNQIQRTSEEAMIGYQALSIAVRFEEVLMRQIRLEQKKASKYERTCTEELLLRIRAVDYLRRHEKIRFKKVNDITEMRKVRKNQ